eukprot:Trichotokara_eunicae@DN4364_c0_g1_i1.p1
MSFAGIQTAVGFILIYLTYAMYRHGWNETYLMSCYLHLFARCANLFTNVAVVITIFVVCDENGRIGVDSRLRSCILTGSLQMVAVCLEILAVFLAQRVGALYGVSETVNAGDSLSGFPHRPPEEPVSTPVVTKQPSIASTTAFSFVAAPAEI